MKGFITFCLLVATLDTSAQQVAKWQVADLDHFLTSAKKPVILNLWATYCQPCAEEIPYFQSILASFGQGKADLILLSLDLPGYYPAKIETFAHDHGFHAPIAWLNESDADIFGPHIDSSWTGVLPSTIMYNPISGYRKFYQEQLTPERFRQALAAMLK